MTGLFGGVLQSVILASWMLTLLWGSIMAVRGARNWSTILQVVGASAMLAGALSFVISLVVLYTTIAGTSGPGAGPGVLGVVAAVGGILLLLGLILFTAGYVGMAAKYGATESRARELEGLVMQLQARMQGQSEV